MLAKDLFKVIPESFFSLLSSEKKYVYLDCLFILYQYMGGHISYSCRRDEVMPLLVEYFSEQEEVLYDEEGQAITDACEQANAVIRRLIRTRWLSQRFTNNYEEIIGFHDYAITILQAFESLLQNKKLALQGLVYRVYSALKNMDAASVTVALNEVYSGTARLIAELKKLHANLDKYLQRVFDELKDDDPSALIHLHFEDYMKDETYAAYHRLKTSENVSKFRPFILERLESLRSNEVLLDIVNNELLALEEFKTLSEAQEDTLKKINEVITQFRQLDEYILKIDEKQNRYIAATVTKLRFLMHKREDIEGKINHILKHIVHRIKAEDLNVHEEVLPELDGLFNLYQQRMIDYQSLYTVKRRSRPFNPKPIDRKVTMSSEEREARLHRLMQRQRYSKRIIDRRVRELLDGRTVMNASSLPLETNADFLLLIYIYLYGHTSRMSYTVKLLQHVVETDRFRFNDFEIRRK